MKLIKTINDLQELAEFFNDLGKSENINAELFNSVVNILIKAINQLVQFSCEIQVMRRQIIGEINERFSIMMEDV
jgi:hypothetical protein